MCTAINSETSAAQKGAKRMPHLTNTPIHNVLYTSYNIMLYTQVINNIIIILQKYIHVHPSKDGTLPLS